MCTQDEILDFTVELYLTVRTQPKQILLPDAEASPGSPE